ncbi:hypothetical protein [Brucella anthropi]|uniref:hypothetical protein n=1 Tax=Brucella anthropi TaxID=529 RepID=UPI001CFF37CC|nr:hypothetical protein [Brucella anthropi]
MLNGACTYGTDLYGLKSSAAMPAYSESEIIRTAFNRPSLDDTENIAKSVGTGKELIFQQNVQSHQNSAISNVAYVVIRDGECKNPRGNQASGVYIYICLTFSDSFLPTLVLAQLNIPSN